MKNNAKLDASYPHVSHLNRIRFYVCLGDKNLILRFPLINDLKYFFS